MADNGKPDTRRKLKVRLLSEGEAFPYTLRGSDITVQLRRVNDDVRRRLRQKAHTRDSPLGEHLPKVLDEEEYERLVFAHVVVNWNPEDFVGANGEPMACTDENKARLPDEVRQELWEATREMATNYVLSPVSAEEDAIATGAEPGPFVDSTAT